MRAAKEPVTLVTVARLVPKKGIEDAIRAVAALAPKYPTLSFHIVGDGPQRSGCQTLIEELGVQNQIRLLGQQPAEGVKHALKSADIFVAPSYTASDGDIEGIPVAIMEAMASGLPVVSTNHSGIPELVMDGVTGCLVAERDVTNIAARLSWRSIGPRSARRWAERGVPWSQSSTTSTRSTTGSRAC